MKTTLLNGKQAAEYLDKHLANLYQIEGKKISFKKAIKGRSLVFDKNVLDEIINKHKSMSEHERVLFFSKSIQR